MINEKDFDCKDFSKIIFYFLDSSLNNLSIQRSIILKIYKYKVFGQFITIFKLYVKSKNKIVIIKK